MSRHVRRIAIAAVVLATLTARAAADPVPVNLSDYVHLHSISHVLTDGGTKLDLPPGYFMSEPTHDRLDAETKRLQDAETRLKAENKSMRSSLDGWQPGFYTMLTMVVGGVALGWYAHSKL